MAENEVHRRAMEALRAMEADAIERARAEAAQARAEASGRTGRAAKAQPDVLSLPLLGPYRPPSPGEQAAMAAGDEVLAHLQAMESARWRLKMPLGGDR
jgi:hypothetical protein